LLRLHDGAAAFPKRLNFPAVRTAFSALAERVTRSKAPGERVAEIRKHVALGQARLDRMVLGLIRQV
jgi:hypothetical protein